MVDKLLRKCYAIVGPTVFEMTGKRPWRFGYSPYKQREIARVLENGGFDPMTLPPGYGFRLDERIVEYPWFFSRLPDSKGLMLDAGSVLNHGYLLRQPKLASKQIFISTLAPEVNCFWRRGISYVYEDVRRSCFRDNQFDWIVSLSTIEHIGMDNTMLYTADATKREDETASHLVAIKEYSRMLKPGGTLYVSVPFGKHLNYGWFQIFDADMVDRVIDTFGPKRLNEFHYRYEPSGWVVSTRQQSANATYFDIHKTRQYDPDYAAASRAVVCLELVK